MSDVEEAVRTILTGDVTVDGLVGTRIYPLHRSRRVGTLPAITYQETSGPRINDLAGPDGLAFPSFQVNSIAATNLGARTLANAVRSALNGYTGVSATVVVGDIILQNEFYLSGTEPENEGADVYAIGQDYEVWFGE